MKIYEDIKEYENDLKYWSNSCGELHYHGERDITEEELPKELQELYSNHYNSGCGSYCYLAEYRGTYGIALINEYHEYTDEGKEGEANNFDRAVRTAEKFEKQFHEITVFIGKKTGFPGEGPDGDNATEMVVFISYAQANKGVFRAVSEWLYNNAYAIGLDEIRLYDGGNAENVNIKNMYCTLYYNFVDENICHIQWRLTPKIDEWDEKKAIKECRDLIDFVCKQDKLKGLGEFLDKYRIPDSLMPAIEKIKAA